MPCMENFANIAEVLGVEVWELFVESQGDKIQPILIKDESGRFVEIGSVKKQ